MVINFKALGFNKIMLNTKMNLVEPTSSMHYHSNDYNNSRKNIKSLICKLQPTCNQQLHKKQHRKSQSDEKKMQFKISNLDYRVFKTKYILFS